MNHRRGSASVIAVLALLAGGALLPSRALAGWDRVTSGTVAQIQLGTDGNFSVALTGSPDLCPGPAAKSWEAVHALVTTGYGATTDGVKALYAALLAAQLSGRTVTLYVLNAPSKANCLVGAIDIW